MKKLVMVFALVAGVGVGVSAENLSQEQFVQFFGDCLDNQNISSCQRLANSGVLASVEQCNKETCNDIGVIYKLAAHYQQAVKYYERACELNDEWGCGNLANSYNYGEGVKQNYNTAFKIQKKACDLNHTTACANVGIAYKQGLGVKQDFASAKKYYEKACNANHAGACNNLGVLYANGQGVRQDYSTAKKYFGKSCDLGHQMGCDNYKEFNQRGIQ